MSADESDAADEDEVGLTLAEAAGSSRLSSSSSSDDDADESDASQDVDGPTLPDLEDMMHDYAQDTWGEEYRDRDAITLDIADLRDCYEELADDVVSCPDWWMGWLDADSRVSAETPGVDGRAKTDTTIQIVGTEAEEWSIGESPRGREGHVVTVEATVSIRKDRSSVAPQTAWQCQRCGTHTFVSTSEEWYPNDPPECAGCERQGPFAEDKDQTEYWDYREVLLEELSDDSEVSGDPESIRAEAVRQEIVDDVDVPAGERVRLTGILRTESDIDSKDVVTYLDIRDCESLDRDSTVGSMTEEDWAVIESILQDPDRSLLDEIASAIHPTATREDALRAGVLAVVGSPDGMQSGSRVRGDIHALYIGDPGAGKSTMVDALSSVTPKYGMTAGGTSTSVGLTAAATQDGIGASDSGWVIKPGMLPRSHDGVLFLNEFDDVEASARKELTDALESGEVQVSKAGIDGSFPAATTVIATANPQFGSFRSVDSEPLAEQIQFSDPLKSRFDLIFPFESEADWETDMALSESVLEGHMSTDEDSADNDDSDLDRDLIRRYVAYLRDNVDPVIPDDDDVTSKIKWTYSKIREHASGRGLPVDPRIASALARISRAHARLRGSEQVAEADVDVAVNLMEASLMQLGVLDEMLESTDTMSVSEAAARADLSSADEPSVSQSERREAIVDAVESMVDTSADGVYRAVSEDLDIDRDTFDDEWDSMLSDGTLVLTGDGEAEVLR